MAVIPLSDLAPRWAWAILDHDRQRFGVGVLALNETADADPAGQLADAVEVAREGFDELKTTAVAVLARHGFEPVTSWAVPEGHRWRQVARVRPSRPVPPGRGPVPYAAHLAKAVGPQPVLGRDGDELDFDAYGPPPGYVDFAIRTLHHARTTADGPEYREAARRLADRTADADDTDKALLWHARQTLDKFLAWFRDKVSAHGWPRYGVDAHSTIELVLFWVSHYPDPAFVAECRDQVRDLVATDEADPDHLAVLEAAESGRQST